MSHVLSEKVKGTLAMSVTWKVMRSCAWSLSSSEPSLKYFARPGIPTLSLQWKSQGFSVHEPDSKIKLRVKTRADLYDRAL